MKKETERAYIELNLGNLEHNIAELQKAMPKGCELMAVVKAQGYGHGMTQIACHAQRMGVKAFAVATIDEGISLRSSGIKGDILILGYTAARRAKELEQYDLIQTLIDFHYASEIEKQKVCIRAHLKIDTGMHRLGVEAGRIDEIEKIFAMKHIRAEGIFTHLGCAQSLEKEDVDFTKGQIDCFYRLLDELREDGLTLPKIHIQSSYGLINYPWLTCDYVRAGVALYGVHTCLEDAARCGLDLRPVLSLKTRVIMLRRVKKGECVGYDRAFQANRDSRIAILPIGYADGFPRNLSCGKGQVLIRGQYAPIIGRICMDQMAVDVSDIKGVRTGEPVTLISNEEQSEISAPAVAGYACSISNELLSRLGQRLPAVLV